MTVHLVNFATANFASAQRRLNSSALAFGVDRCLPFTAKELKRTEFYRQNREILDQERGAGYWLWKPYIILEAMDQAEEGDIIIYSDAGAEVIGDLSPLLEICRRQQGLTFFQVPSFFEPHTCRKWTKRDCFILMEADAAKYHQAIQVAGSPQLYLNDQRNREFVTEWLSWCRDPRILTDLPNTLGHRNYPEFLDHRHDQSVLSILAVRHGLPTFRDPSQYGDHLKLPRFRKPGELPRGVEYAANPQENSPYGTLFHLHRQRNFSLRHKLARGAARIRSFSAKAGVPARPGDDPSLSIGITTFVHRFEEYFIPLLTRIREYDRETEIIVVVNGEHRQLFDEGYRQSLLRFLADQPKVFPVLFPIFRGVAKLWNTIIVHASHDQVLILNDDIMINRSDFLAEVKRHIVRNQGRTFTINRSWSHFVASREEIDYLGYFDERLLGIGEEDGDITWRYYQEFRREIANARIKGFKNFAEDSVHSYRPANIECHSGTKYSRFNREFINRKYRPDPAGFQGMFDQPVRLVDPGPDQYPNERFYRANRDKL